MMIYDDYHDDDYDHDYDDGDLTIVVRGSSPTMMMFFVSCLVGGKLWCLKN